MSNEDNPIIPDDEGTQSLNKMALELKNLRASVEALETKVDAQSRNTNANLLTAFAQMLEQAKLDFAEIVKNEIAQAKEEIKAEITKEIKDFVSQEINGFKADTQQEFKQLKLLVKNTDRQFYQALKYIGEVATRTEILEDRVELIDARLPNQ